MLIGLTGLAGSGKSTIADTLIANYGFRRLKFADPLKNMLRSVLRDIGYCASDIERYIEGDLKESLIPELGVTSREAQKDIGQRLGRECWGADVWANIGAARTETFDGERLLFDDVRHLNELQKLNARGGVVWRVERPGIPIANHPSEIDIPTLPVDRIIANTGTLLNLHAAADEAARLMGLTPCA